jgi:tRNA-specific adenosine deaminase 1
MSVNSCLREVKLNSAIRTGMKCLPKSKIPSVKGIVLHDCHAEIIALRAFNRYLLAECALLAQDSRATSLFVEPRNADQVNEKSPQPFTIKHNVSIHMYCSEAPCGDASMELVMQAQEDATPWELPQLLQGHSEGVSNNSVAEMKGRGCFSELGIVRRKPGGFNPSNIRKILTNL